MGNTILHLDGLGVVLVEGLGVALERRRVENQSSDCHQTGSKQTLTPKHEWDITNTGQGHGT